LSGRTNLVKESPVSIGAAAAPISPDGSVSADLRAETLQD
jgi:hypothetical protein